MPDAITLDQLVWRWMQINRISFSRYGKLGSYLIEQYIELYVFADYATVLIYPWPKWGSGVSRKERIEAADPKFFDKLEVLLKSPPERIK